MAQPFKKASRTQTQKRLDEVARDTVGEATALDDAFAAFEGPLGDDPEKIREAQARIRELLLPNVPLTQ